MQGGEETRELLARELGKLSAAHVERAMTAAAPLTIQQLGFMIDPGATAHGTAVGARIGARFTKVGRYETELELASAPERTLDVAHDVLTAEGSMRDAGDTNDVATLAAIVRSGFFNMNPALVRVAVAPAPSGSHVRIDAAALEGLIPQHTANKASKRIAKALVNALGGSHSNERKHPHPDQGLARCSTKSSGSPDVEA